MDYCDKVRKLSTNRIFMATMITKLSWQGELKFSAKNHKGFETLLDGNTLVAPSPMELLLEAVAGCSSIDVVLILQKMREPLEKLEITIAGDRFPSDPKYFTLLRAQFDLWGTGLHAEKVSRAINLSFAKYCSVFHSLRKDLEIVAEFRLNSAEAGAPSGEFFPVKILLAPE